jgi:hypothetical protein
VIPSTAIVAMITTTTTAGEERIADWRLQAGMPLLEVAATDRGPARMAVEHAPRGIGLVGEVHHPR